MENNQIVEVMPFGKYKGRQLGEAVARDPQYFQWLMQQSNLRERHLKLYENLVAIIQGTGLQQNECSPEHNQLQIKFLEKSLVDLIAKRACKKAYEERIQAIKDNGELWGNWFASLKETEIIEPPKTDYDYVRTKAYEECIKSRERLKTAFSKINKALSLVKTLPPSYDGVLDMFPASVCTEIPVGRYFCDIAITSAYVSEGPLNYYIDNESFDGYNHLDRDLLKEYLKYHAVRGKFNYDPIPEAHINNVRVKYGCTFIELKPIVGDDYPQLLRKAKQFYQELHMCNRQVSNYINRTTGIDMHEYKYAIITETYNGSAPIETVKKMFSQDSINFKLLSEITTGQQQ
jgi:uncharacterized protein (DUF3820 family)